MKTKILVCLVLLILGTCSLLSGQDYFKYYQLVREAEQLYDTNEFLKSGQKYSEAFVALGNKGMMEDRYNAACSWSMAGEMDSSFIQLFKIANGNFREYDYLLADTDFQPLYQDPRWAEVVEIVKTNKEKAEANLNKALVAILDTIEQDDQQLREQSDDIEKKFGWESQEMKNLWNLIREKDSMNLIKIEEILGEYGWLGADVVGEEGNQTIFLVIQHSDLAIQEKYLPMMREAVKNGNASAVDLAYLEDRVAIRQGKKQIYGSQITFDGERQIYYVSPLEDPDNVDKRRAEVGLPSMAVYLSYFNLKWDVEQYKKDLPSFEAREKDINY